MHCTISWLKHQPSLKGLKVRAQDFEQQKNLGISKA